MSKTLKNILKDPMKINSLADTAFETLDSDGDWGLVDRLRGIGVETEEEGRIVCLLGGLLPKYETLKIQLLNQDSISYLQVCEKLLSTAAMLDSDRSNKKESGGESGASAHAAKAAAG